MTSSMFSRQSTGLPPRHLLGAIDASTEDHLDPQERRELDAAVGSMGKCCDECAGARGCDGDRVRGLDGSDHAVNEACAGGVRVLRRADGDNSPTAAETCSGSDATKPSKGGQLTPDQIKTIGDALGKVVNGLGQVLNPQTGQPVGPPPTPTIIPGVPDGVLLGGLVLIVVVILVVRRKG